MDCGVESDQSGRRHLGVRGGGPGSSRAGKRAIKKRLSNAKGPAFTDPLVRWRLCFKLSLMVLWCVLVHSVRPVDGGEGLCKPILDAQHRYVTTTGVANDRHGLVAPVRYKSLRVCAI